MVTLHVGRICPRLRVAKVSIFSLNFVKRFIYGENNGMWMQVEPQTFRSFIVVVVKAMP